MTVASTEIVVRSVRAVLSPSRFATYEVAAGVKGDDDPSALALYAWNARVSGELLAPLHFCEVVIRNAVSDALEAQYGHQWPWSQGFERSLPDPQVGYSPRKDLLSARRNKNATGSVIPELAFVFWQKMFTSRYDARLWQSYLLQVLPNLNQARAIASLRQDIYDDLDQIRRLRNRIAHHEPIFTRHLEDDFNRIIKLIEFRCPISAAWLVANQQALAVIKAKP